MCYDYDMILFQNRAKWSEVQEGAPLGINMS